MAIGTVVWGSSSMNSGGGASLTPGYPASPATGDLLLAFCYCRANTPDCFTQPADWSTLVQTATANGTYAVFYRAATGSESGTLSISSAAPSNATQGAFICKVPGAKTASILDGTPTAETEAAASPVTNAGVTTGAAGSLIVYFTGKGDGASTGNYSAWSGHSLTWAGVTAGSTSGSDAAIGIGTAPHPDASATSTLSVTAALPYVGISYAFAVAADAGVALAGTSAGAATTCSGAITTVQALLGSGAGTATCSSDLTVELPYTPLIGESAGASTAAGDLAVAYALLGTAAGAAVCGAADMATTQALAGLGEGWADGTGSVTMTQTVEGAACGLATTSGVLDDGLTASSAMPYTAEFMAIGMWPMVSEELERLRVEVCRIKSQLSGGLKLDLARVCENLDILSGYHRCC